MALKARTALTPPRLCLSLALLCLAASPCAAEKIVEIKITGNETVSREVILKAIGSALGEGEQAPEPLLPLAQARSLLLRLGYFEDVSVTAQKVADGYSVAIVVRERVRISKVGFEGNTQVSDEDLVQGLRSKPGRFLDKALVERDVKRIGYLYEDRGIVARVSDVKVSEEGEITFLIVELVVSKVSLKGLRYVPDEKVSSLISVEGGKAYDEEKHAASLRALRGTGWFEEVTVEAKADPEGPEGRVVLEFQFKERPGLFPERTGAPRGDIDPKALRADVGPIKLDIECVASVRINNFLLDLGDDVDEALARLAKAAEAQDAPADAVLSYARALDALERRDEARSRYARAAELYRQLAEKQPRNPEPRSKLGVCLDAIGKTDEALEALREGVKLAPNRWQPRVEFARVAGLRVLGGLRVDPDSLDALKRSPVVRAAVELLQWERSHDAILALLETSDDASHLLELAREVNASIAEARRLAPREVAVLRAACDIAFGAVYVTALVLQGDADVWGKVRADVDAFVKGLGDIADTDPVLSLWTAMFHSFRAIAMLTGRSVSGVTEAELTAEFSAVGGRLEMVSRQWPQALRASGNMLGILQFAAGENELAKATFEASLKQNPHNRMNYNGLLGVAATAGDWAEMDRIVRRRVTVAPAAEDYILLGKLALELGKESETLGHFRKAAEQFPNNAVGYFATAGWLVHLGADDAEARSLLDRGFALDEGNAYAHAVSSALHILGKRPAEANAELKAALATDPKDELANLLREKYFIPAE